MLYYLADEGGDFLLSPTAGLAILAALVAIAAVVVIVLVVGSRKKGPNETDLKS
jgi:hypothetical protein